MSRGHPPAPERIPMPAARNIYRYTLHGEQRSADPLEIERRSGLLELRVITDIGIIKENQCPLNH